MFGMMIFMIVVQKMQIMSALMVASTKHKTAFMTMPRMLRMVMMMRDDGG